MSEIINGYEIIGEWHQANEGIWAECQKGGRSYFIKKYDKVATQPDPGKIGKMYTERAYEAHLQSFNTFKERRNGINSALKTISGAGGNIVLPLESFLYDHCYTEVSNFYGDMLSEEQIIALPAEDKKTLLTSLTKTLNGVHSLNIVHSDIKVTNVVCTKNSLGRYVLKLIDFGASYFTTDRPTDPEDYSGDQNYASPELGMVWMCKEAELEPEEYINQMTTKSDIFSLGVLFHILLCGKRPTYTGIDLESKFGDREERLIYPFEVVLNGGNLQVDPAIADEKYSAAIEKMIKTDPNERPTANEVLRIIQGHTTAAAPTPTAEPTVKETFRPTAPASIKVDAPWETDGIVWADNIEDLLRAQGYTKLERTKNFLGNNAYCLTDSGNKKISSSKASLLEKGFAIAADGSSAATGEYGDTDAILRPEDAELYHVNTELLRSKKIKLRAAEKLNNATRQMTVGYEIFEQNTGSKYLKSTKNLVQFNYLTRK